MITKFDNFINESIFSRNKNKNDIPIIKYDCKEYTEELALKYDFSPLEKFDFEDKKQISLFVGDIAPMHSKNLSIYDFDINKNIGFGLSKNSRRKIRVTLTKHKDMDMDFYKIKFNYPTYQKTFICENIMSCFRKIREVEKSDDDFENRIIDEPIEINEL